MPSWWFPRAKPSEEPTPDDGYDAFFSGDGTEGTTAGTLYRKDFNGVVTPVGTGGGGGGSYTDEQAQDAVGRILTDTATVDFTYNDGANTITAVVVPGSIGATQIATGGVGTGQLAANAVTNAVLADMPGATVKGRPAGAAGDPQDLNATQIKALMSFSSTDIGDFTEAAQDAVGSELRDSASVNLAYNDAAGTITANIQALGIATGMIQANAVTSAQLAASSVTTVKIAADAVSNDKLDNMPTQTFKANSTSGSANPTDVTVSATKTMLAYTASEIAVGPIGTINVDTVQEALQALYTLILSGGGGGGGGAAPGTDFNVVEDSQFAGGVYWNGIENGQPTFFNNAVILSDNSDVTYIVGSATPPPPNGSFPQVGGRYYVQFSIYDIVAFQVGTGAFNGFEVKVRCSGPRASTLTVQNLAGPAIGAAQTAHYTSNSFAIQEISVVFTNPTQLNWGDGDLRNLQLVVALDVNTGYQTGDAGHVPINTNVGPTISDTRALKIYKLTVTPSYI